MAATKLIVESGATKAEWCLISSGKKKTAVTQGISPYFFTEQKIVDLLQNDLLPQLGKSKIPVGEIYYYGTGMLNPDNVRMVNNALEKVFQPASIEISDDLLAAARSLNGNKQGLVCNLGTGSLLSKRLVSVMYSVTKGAGLTLEKKLFNIIYTIHLMKISGTDLTISTTRIAQR